ncbi:MAG: NifB/NifX family molybdenum-iron cluster-binding protein [Planctomycetota bacterium]
MAMPIWNGRISPVFDTAQRLLVCDLEKGEVLSRREEDIRAGTPDCRVTQLTRHGIDALVCGAISRPLAGMVVASGVRLVPFVAGAVDDVLRAFVAGELPDPAFLMPGCCGRRRRFRGQRRGASWRKEIET